ncbi:MAG: hypothetical protein QM756_35955 [Polyangiaceae bacterium]
MTNLIRATSSKVQTFSAPVAQPTPALATDVAIHTTGDQLVRLLLIQTLERLQFSLGGSPTPIEQTPTPQPPAFEVVKDLPAETWAVNPEHVALLLLNTKPNGNSVKVGSQTSGAGTTLTPIGSSAAPVSTAPVGSLPATPTTPGTPATKPTPDVPVTQPAPNTSNFVTRQEFSQGLARLPEDVKKAVAEAMSSTPWQANIQAAVDRAVGAAIQNALADGGALRIALDDALEDSWDEAMADGGRLSDYVESHVSEALDEATNPDEDTADEDVVKKDVPNGIVTRP